MSARGTLYGLGLGPGEPDLMTVRAHRLLCSATHVAFGAIRRQPWVVGTGTDERIEPRWVTQLAVSFDHRSVDGQQGSEFLADVAAVLHDPGLALL